MTQITARSGKKSTAIQIIDFQHANDALTARFAPFAAKMARADVPTIVIESFRHYYKQLLRGGSGYIPATEAQPVVDLPMADTLERFAAVGAQALPQTAVIKLNGGLGTTMGMHSPKSLLVVKAGLTFLDIIVRQILHTRTRHDVTLPLILMNSFTTRQPALAALAAYPELEQPVPLDFCQHKVPRIWQSDLSPVTWPADPKLEWSPPGHGDLYLALQTSGMLAQLLAQGYDYLFVSNADNLGATIDLNILGYFAEEKLPFLMEVTERQPADRKGGHLAINSAGNLILREVAQCPPDELTEFQDIQRYSYFNTNNLWLHLPTLQRLLTERQGFFSLPLIRNEKPVDPTEPTSSRVYQLEAAMGQAIAFFPGAQALVVDRSRFLPVKNTNDLLAISSDAYILDRDAHVRINPERQFREAPMVNLDKHIYGLIDHFHEHFPQAIPSLVNCEKLSINGNFYVDGAVTFMGTCTLQHEGEEALQLTNRK